MLRMEKPDGAYIAVTPNDHYRLSMLCLKYGVPCSAKKGHVPNSREAKEVFAVSKEKRHLCDGGPLEPLPSGCMGSRRMAGEGRIGKAKLASCTIGFRADPDPENVIIHRSSEAGHRKILLSMP